MRPRKLLQIELLSWCEIVVEHDGVAVDPFRYLADLARFAGSDEGRSVGRCPALDDTLDGVGSGCVYEQAELIERGIGGFGVGSRKHHPYQHDALAECSLDQSIGGAAELTEAAAVGIVTCWFSHWRSRCRRCAPMVR